MLHQLCVQNNLPVEATKYGLALLLSFPIALAVRNSIEAKNQTREMLPHLVNFIATSLLTIFLFSTISYIIILSSVLLVYTLNLAAVHPSATFILIFIQLLAIQIKVQIYPDEEFVDFSSIMMIMIIKLTSFSFAYHDRLAKSLDDYQKSHVIQKLPNLIEFLGYTFNIVGYFVGPGLEFKDYINWSRNLFPYNLKSGLLFESMQRLLLGVVLMVVHLGLEKRYHFSLVVEPWFQTMSWYQKLGYVMVSGLIVRFKFHAAWKVSEAIGILSGLGFGIKNGERVFDKCENVDILSVEFGENPKMMMDSWNKYTANWLRRYIYTRVTVPSLKLPLTFIVSAVWHGVYAGYYTTFISSILLTEAARATRKCIRPLFANSRLSVFYDIIGRLVSMSMMNYLVVSFILREGKDVVKGWYYLGFYGHFLMIGTLIGLKLFGNFLKQFHATHAKSQ